MRVLGFSSGPFQTNCYIIVDDSAERACLIDAGMGTRQIVTRVLEEEGLTLEAIFLTHGHIDHTRDAAMFGVPVFIHEADAFMLDHGRGLSASTLQLFDAASMSAVSDLRTFSTDGGVGLAGFSFEAIHAPGHSPGSVLYQMGDVVFSGDVVFAGSVGRTDLPYSDPEAMKVSLSGPVWAIDDENSLLPGHGPATTMEHERASNPFLLEAREQES